MSTRAASLIWLFLVEILLDLGTETRCFNLTLCHSYGWHSDVTVAQAFLDWEYIQTLPRPLFSLLLIYMIFLYFQHKSDKKKSDFHSKKKKKKKISTYYDCKSWTDVFLIDLWLLNVSAMAIYHFAFYGLTPFPLNSHRNFRNTLYSQTEKVWQLHKQVVKKFACCNFSFPLY